MAQEELSPSHEDLLRIAEELTDESVRVKAAPGDPAYVAAEQAWAAYDAATGRVYHE